MRLDESDRMFRDTLREFLEREVAPDLPEADHEPVSKEQAVTYQRDLGDLGVGPGAGEDASFEDPVTYAVTIEEIARVWPSLVMMITMGFPFPAALVPYAGDRTREALGDRSRAGELVGCLAVTEPAGGSDTTSPATTAERDGDEYVIDGEKTWVSNATIADVALVLATDVDTGARDFFLVDAETTSLESRELDKLGWKGSPTGQLFLDECRIPVENRLLNAVGRMASEGGTNVLENPIFRTQDPQNAMFAYMRTGMASMAVGIMQASFEATLDYATERTVGGGPIAGKQLVQDHLYEMKAGVETARLLTHHAATHVAEGHADARLLSSLAKGYACETVVDVASRAVQVHGANGLSTDYPVERYLRDARTTTIPDGTTEIQKLIVGSELTGHAAY
ncbi:acyl-CoA dehydrogenase family protein [Haloglomus halophilum]|uniref:acyl-CoA dehydrogenase family protein n=1 Tax=Haloglomus halophilum TaxID=2962672 RepID=UPI0020C9BDF6|nr:acyl-CoA dehydrogenase family protein [Haloglomus halophilum]